MGRHRLGPGSPEAMRMGCVCPAQELPPGAPDNHEWWIVVDCPMHRSWIKETLGQIERRYRREVS